MGWGWGRMMYLHARWVGVWGRMMYFNARWVGLGVRMMYLQSRLVDWWIGQCIYMTGANDSSPVPNNCYGFFINQIKNFHHMLKIIVQIYRILTYNAHSFKLDKTSDWYVIRFSLILGGVFYGCFSSPEVIAQVSFSGRLVSRTTEPISTNLGTNNSCVKRIYDCSKKYPFSKRIL